MKFSSLHGLEHHSPFQDLCAFQQSYKAGCREIGFVTGCNASAAALDAGSVSVSNTWSERTEVHRAERIPRSGFAEQLDLETDEPFEGAPQSPSIFQNVRACFACALACR